MSDHERQSPKSIITVQPDKLASEFDRFDSKIKALERTKNSFKTFKESYLTYRKRMELSDKLLEINSKRLIERRQEAPNISRVTFIHPFYYLGFVESVGNAMTNMIVMILVASGIDFVIKEKGSVKHITSIEDLETERVSLGTKLNFLRENKMTEFSNAVDSDLRNHIAHMNLEIRENEIYVKGKPIAPVVTKAAANLFWALIWMESFIEELAKETGLASETTEKE